MSLENKSYIYNLRSYCKLDDKFQLMKCITVEIHLLKKLYNITKSNNKTCMRTSTVDTDVLMDH